VRGASGREVIGANPGPRQRKVAHAVHVEIADRLTDAPEKCECFLSVERRGNRADKLLLGLEHLLSDIDQHTRRTAAKRKSATSKVSAVSGKAIGSLTCAFVQAYRPSSDAEPEQNTHRIRFPGSNIATRCSQISSRRHVNQTNTLPTPASNQFYLIIDSHPRSNWHKHESSS